MSPRHLAFLGMPQSMSLPLLSSRCCPLSCPAKGHPGGLPAPLGMGDPPSPIPPISSSPGRWMEQGVSLGTMGPAGGLGDPHPCLHSKYENLAVKNASPGVGGVGGCQGTRGCLEGTWGHTLRWPCPPRAR